MEPILVYAFDYDFGVIDKGFVFGRLVIKEILFNA